MRYKLIIAYDGTSYAGWQIQPNGISIQSLVEEALSTILRSPIKCLGSGRTDAGVHAKGQVAHFDISEKINLSKTHFSLNALLPPDIRITHIEEVPSDFHARFSATSKIYHYHIHLDPILDPHLRLYRHHLFGPFDLGLVKVAIPHFLGEKDFFSFANEGTRGSASRDSVRNLYRIDLIEQKGGIRLEFEGDGFLYKMVRNITGTLIEVGQRKVEQKKIPEIFAKKDRRYAGQSAPAKGLFLMQVIY